MLVPQINANFNCLEQYNGYDFRNRNQIAPQFELMLLDILLFMGVFFCLMTAFLIRFRFNKDNSFSGHLLALTLFLIALCNCFYLLIIYGIINYFPVLYKMPAPITYLIFPLSYLYVRAVLHGNKSFRTIDVVHLIPFLFFVVNYFPFYLMDLDAKRELVFEITRNFALTYTGQDGLLPEWINIACRAFMSILYLVFQWNLILSFFRQNQDIVSKQFSRVKKWVYDFTLIQTIHSFSLLVLYAVNALIVLEVIPSVLHVHHVLGFFVNGSFLVVSAYLLWNPKLLIGLPDLPLKHIGANYNSLRNGLQSIFDRIDLYLKQEREFLDADLTVNTLSKAVEIAPRRISYAISESEYDNFNDYINHLRIQFATEKIRAGYLNQYSVDALSETSGFNSKNAFYRAFKKIHHCTPGKYLSEQKIIQPN